MPIYEYECKDCDKVSEFLVGVTPDNPEIKCNYCGGNKMRKIFSQAFVLSNKHFINSPKCTTCSEKTEACMKSPCSTEM